MEQALRLLEIIYASAVARENLKFMSKRLLQLQNIRTGLFDDDGRGRMGYAWFGRDGTC